MLFRSAMAQSSSHEGHSRVKKVGVHKAMLPMADVREINRFVKWAKEDPRRLISLQEFLKIT